MLEKDVKYMLNSNWEPKVPTTQQLVEQSSYCKKHGICPNVRFYEGLVVGNDTKPKVFRLKPKRRI